MSMICFYCAEPVYTAETKTYDGKTFHHGVCFGIWKKEVDRELANERNAEYYKTPDVSTTKIREPNYNTVIYATQYNPTGTQPHSGESSTSSTPLAGSSGDTVTALPVFPVVARQRASSFSRRPYSGTFVPRPASGTFMQTSSDTWTHQSSSTFPRSQSSGTIGRARAGTETRSDTITKTSQSSDTITKTSFSTVPRPTPTPSGSTGSWVPNRKADTLTSSGSGTPLSSSSGSWVPTKKADTFTKLSSSSGTWISSKRDAFPNYSSRGSGTITS